MLHCCADSISASNKFHLLSQTPTSLNSTEQKTVPWQLQIAVYGIGLFSTSMFYMSAVIIPLWVWLIDESEFLAGLVAGSRHFLPLLFSIHGGALMDRLGARRVMIFFAAIGIIVSLLFPVMPWIWAVLLLQMIAGLSDSMGWLGAQTLIGQHMRGSTVYTGRLSFTCRFGHLLAPPLIGWIWHNLGPNWAFIVLAIWGIGTLICGIMLPDAKHTSLAEPTRSGHQLKFTVKNILPRLSDYVDGFKLLAVSAIAFVVMGSMLNHVGASVQSSLYVRYLGEEGYTATEIGWLFSISSVAAAIGALTTSKMELYIKPYWLILGTVLTGVLAITLTPLFGIFILLLLASSARGFANGMSQPMIISTVLRAVSPDIRGTASGLRGTMNRISSICTPILMGTVAEFMGWEAGFYSITCLVIVLAGGLILYVKLSKELSESNKVSSMNSDDPQMG